MYKIIKRLLDIIGALILLPFVLLEIVIIAPIIWLTDKGPVFYIATRAGKGYKPFKMFKLRSMYVNSPDWKNPDGSTFNSDNDPRVTPIGRIMRKTSLDEFPQFLNILLGDMSFVGPRPKIYNEGRLDGETNHDLIKSFSVKPGVTGYAQAFYRNSITQDEKLHWDAYYSDHISFWMDVKIIWQTVVSVIARKNINSKQSYKVKKLMIVGASVLQLPAILKAKEMGLEVAVVDFNPQAIGIPYADEYYNASTMDEDAVLAAAEAYKPDGIMTLATDMPMRGVAKTSDKLHLHSINYETAVKATDKYDMIKAFKEYNVPSPWFFVADSLEELKAHERELTFPCIIKPTDNAGSHGVAKVFSFQELIDNYEYAHSCSHHGKVIVEEYLDGPEVSVEVMVVNGEVNILQITDKITTEAPHFVEMGHTQPSQLPNDVQCAIRNVTEAACKAIGIDRGPAHVEMKVTKRGPVMIELGARMGGDNITTHLVPLSTGIDMVGSTIKVALGEEPDIEPTLHCGSAIRYFEVPFGIINAIENVEAAQRVPGVKQITFTKNVGEQSTPIHCSNDRIGFVIAQGATAEEAAKTCEEAMNIIRVTIA